MEEGKSQLVSPQMMVELGGLYQEEYEYFQPETVVKWGLPQGLP